MEQKTCQKCDCDEEDLLFELTDGTGYLCFGCILEVLGVPLSLDTAEEGW